MSHRALLIVHLLAASVWIGVYAMLVLGLLPEIWRRREAAPMRAWLQRFGRISVAALLVASLSGLLLAWHWLPDTTLWFNTELPLAQTILAKLGWMLLSLLLMIYLYARVLPVPGNERFGRMLSLVLAQLLLAVMLTVAGSAFRFGHFAN